MQGSAMIQVLDDSLAFYLPGQSGTTRFVMPESVCSLAAGLEMSISRVLRVP